MVSFRLILVAIIWGANFPVVKSALRDFHPLSFTVLRFSLSALALFAAMALTHEPLGIDRRDRRPIVTLALTGITLYNLFFMYGLAGTTASNSALFIATSPLFASLIQAATGRERLTTVTVIGLLLSFTGVLFIMAGSKAGISLGGATLQGDLLTLIAAVFWALYTLEARPLLAKYSPLKVTAYSMAVGTLLLLPLGIVDLFAQSWTTVSAPAWLGLGFSSIVSGSIAFTLWYGGVKAIGATRTIVYHYLVPLVAVLVSALVLDERLGRLQVAGGALIIAGLFVVQKGRNRTASGR
jgi:drug/metabolite transporter (DMT)-like permease